LHSLPSGFFLYLPLHYDPVCPPTQGAILSSLADSPYSASAKNQTLFTAPSIISVVGTLANLSLNSEGSITAMTHVSGIIPVTRYDGNTRGCVLGAELDDTSADLETPLLATSFSRSTWRIAICLRPSPCKRSISFQIPLGASPLWRGMKRSSSF
jgi:hypothetical protein